jgi:hypothetical protein
MIYPRDYLGSLWPPLTLAPLEKYIQKFNMSGHLFALGTRLFSKWSRTGSQTWPFLLFNRQLRWKSAINQSLFFCVFPGWCLFSMIYVRQWSWSIGLTRNRNSTRWRINLSNENGTCLWYLSMVTFLCRSWQFMGNCWGEQRGNLDRISIIFH